MGPLVSHLLYADDALFVGEWSEHNIKNLARVLRCFHAASGLKDYWKSWKRLEENFFGGGTEDKIKIHWVCWENVTTSKEDGRLGVGSIRSINIALLLKWWWLLCTESSALWAKVICGIHKLAENPPHCYSMKTIFGTWNDIAKMGRVLDRKGIDANNLITRNDTIGSQEWKCKIDMGDDYKVNILRRLLDTQPQSEDSKIWWFKEVPIKVICFIWRAKMDRIPIVEALSHRGISLSSMACCQCEYPLETADHVLVQCPFAKTVMEWILRWCGVQMGNAKKATEVLDYASQWGNSPKKKKRLLGICYGVIWSIWKARNERIFIQKKVCATKVADMVKSTTFLWFKFRKEKSNVKWEDWITNPFINL